MRGHPSGSLLDRSFHFSIALKGLDALLEMILGIAILKASPQALSRLALALLHPELSEDPSDFVATHLLRAIRQFIETGGRHFASLYLVSHGLLKIVLVAALFRSKLWAYPAMIVTLAVFVFYQGYRFILTHSLVMIFLTVFDIAVIVLTWLEYRKLKSFVAGHRKDS
jgi:uncharacterized membrane protein